MLKTKEDILELIKQSSFHMEALEAVASLDLADGCIGAGFVRNYVWDHLQGHSSLTPLNDIDVIYYSDEHNTSFERDCEARLKQLMPNLPWSVKNQARMHVKNGDKQYTSLEHALTHWLETATPIAVALNRDKQLELIAPLGIEDLINMRCHATPHAKSRHERLTAYQTRMQAKKWWTIWPDVTVYDLDDIEDLKETA